MQQPGLAENAKVMPNRPIPNILSIAITGTADLQCALSRQ